MAEDRGINEYNMAVSYLNRLNALFYACDDASMNLDAHTWYHSLCAIYRELSTEMKPKEIEIMDANLEFLHERLVENDKHNKVSRRIEMSPNLYKELHKCELQLRRIMKEAGLQSKMVADPRHAL